MKKVQLWSFIQTPNEAWFQIDTAIADKLSSSWLEQKESLEIADSAVYMERQNRLKRQQAIETGLVEGLYDLDEEVAKSLIEQGFDASLVGDADTDIPKEQLMDYLQDHSDAIDFVFEWVKEERPLTKRFLVELHQLVCRHEKDVKGRDVLKGMFKKQSNDLNGEGVIYAYCPAEEVEGEMDRLIEIYHQLEDDQRDPLGIAAWMHHAFWSIHPFQDGNGRMARLLACWVLVKHNRLLFTVLGADRKPYIMALHQAAVGEPKVFMDYFVSNHMRLMLKGLLAELSLKQKELEDRMLQRSNEFWEFRMDQAEHLCAKVLKSCIAAYNLAMLGTLTFSGPIREDLEIYSDSDLHHLRAFIMPIKFFYEGAEVTEERSLVVGLACLNPEDLKTASIGGEIGMGRELRLKMIDANVPLFSINLFEDLEKQGVAVEAFLDTVFTDAIAELVRPAARRKKSSLIN